jgi:hypothetical protein
MGVIGDAAYRDIEGYRETERFAGYSCPQWRSGVKHDCSRVMELSQVDGNLVNGFGQQQNLEDRYLYPLLKGSDVANGRLAPRRYMLVTQTKIGSPTDPIRGLAPLTWAYLEEHDKYLDARKSSIYQGQPRFSIFGVGDYTFAPFKIAICGLYKRLRFELVPPFEGKPIVFDDTVYFLPFDSEQEARSALDALTSPTATKFFQSRVFWDAKRPINKGLLQSFAIQKILDGDNSFGGKQLLLYGSA